VFGDVAAYISGSLLFLFVCMLHCSEVVVVVVVSLLLNSAMWTHTPTRTH